MKLRPRFSLKVLMLFVAVVGIFCAYHVNWIRQRHAFLKNHAEDDKQFDGLKNLPAYSGIQFTAIGPMQRRTKHDGNLLWLFGEHSCKAIRLVLKTDSYPRTYHNTFAEDMIDENWALASDLTGQISLAENLFPEAEIYLGVVKP